MKISEVVMLICAVIGATLLASNTDASKYGFIFYLVSSISGTYAGWSKDVMSLTLLNGFFVCVNMVGIFRWMQ